MIEAAAEQRSMAVSTDESVLDRIMQDGTHLALWRRPGLAAFAWIDHLAWDEIEDLDFATALDVLDEEIDDGLAQANYPEGPDRLALRQAIATLAHRFAGMLGCPGVRIRLEVVDNDACRKFHTDAVVARLLMTLYGPGTQWIEAHAPGRIHQISAGDVAIFKGRLWAEEPRILHRSPPIARTGDIRLLLAIDPSGPVSVEAKGHG